MPHHPEPARGARGPGREPPSLGDGPPDLSRRAPARARRSEVAGLRGGVRVLRPGALRTPVGRADRQAARRPRSLAQPARAARGPRQCAGDPRSPRRGRWDRPPDRRMVRKRDRRPVGGDVPTLPAAGWQLGAPLPRDCRQRHVHPDRIRGSGVAVSGSPRSRAARPGPRAGRAPDRRPPCRRRPRPP